MANIILTISETAAMACGLDDWGESGSVADAMRSAKRIRRGRGVSYEISCDLDTAHSILRILESAPAYFAIGSSDCEPNERRAVKRAIAHVSQAVLLGVDR